MLAQLEPHGTAVSKVLLTTTGLNIEDARLFQFNKQPHISWVVSDFVGQASVHSIVRYGQLTNDMKVTELHTHQPDYGNNDWSTMQKNWVFFEYDGELFCIYDSWPKQVILQITNGVKIFLEHRSAGVRWPWGKIKGGATPLPYEDGLLRFFHSRLDNEEKPCPFRYYVGALVMEKIPPFKVLRVSKQPILRGSMEDDLSPKQIAACQHYKGRVVFPAGALETKDGWVLSVGVNDAACVMCKIREKDLNL